MSWGLKDITQVRHSERLGSVQIRVEGPSGATVGVFTQVPMSLNLKSIIHG